MTGDLGLFGPDSVSWRLHAEPILLLGGFRALYLQALHPLAMAGVIQNSNFREDPWARLGRTSEYVTTVIFGTTEQAEAAGRRVRAIHQRLRGIDPETGDFFRIDEPRLLRWVHVTEVESFLTTATRAGMALSREEIDRYYTEQREAARLVGLDPLTVPGTAAEVDRYYEQMRPELRLTRDSADAALFMAAPPLPHRLGLTPVRLALGGVAALSVSLLPAWARRLYGLPGLPTTDLSAALWARLLRRALALIPEHYRSGPHRDAALARAAAVGALS
ncbi:oxygenase MpaB family protein [Rugosimonospora acidiphila]|uniref:Oxygenase MpaB family protein n=1 Tax=Rugosimonospora acidiphila TaxID=556531 RepID=A0ABP9SAY7_9ACTN